MKGDHTRPTKLTIVLEFTVSSELVLITCKYIYPWDNFFQVEINSAQDGPVAHWMARPNLKNFVLSHHPRYNPWSVIVPGLDEEWRRGRLFWARGGGSTWHPSPQDWSSGRDLSLPYKVNITYGWRNHPSMLQYHPILYLWCACLSHWFFSHVWWWYWKMAGMHSHKGLQKRGACELTSQSSNIQALKLYADRTILFLTDLTQKLTSKIPC